MKAKVISVVILSAALIWSLPKIDTPVNNSTQSTKVQTVQAKLSEKQPQAKAEVKALMEPQPVVEPAAVAIPQTQVPQGCAAYVPLLQQYDWDYHVMAAVMQAESTQNGIPCNPNANNHGVGNYDGIPDYGLLQLHGQEIYDPAENIAHAYAIWQRQGYHAWSTFNDGAYLKYL
jgi:hypothetical protein